jgi:hypothetical protein
LSVLQKLSFLTLFLKFLAAAFWENESKQKVPVPANRIESVFSSVKCFKTKFLNVASIFVPRNGILSCFLFWGLVQNGIPRVCFQFVPGYGIPSIFLFCGMVRNGIPNFFVQQNKTFVSSITTSAELFFVGNFQPYFRPISWSFGSKCLNVVTNEIFISKFSYFAQRWLDFSLIKMFSVLKYIVNRGHSVNST